MWSHIKEILQNEKGKCIIIEDGNPAFVLLPFEEYLQLKKTKPTLAGSNGQKSLENVILTQLNQSQDLALNQGRKIRLEDLPF